MKTIITPEVYDALRKNVPVVALESTVISHGLPFPQNLETAFELERIVRSGGAVPATIAILDGQIRVGLDRDQIEFLASAKTIRKVSRRDLPLMASGEQNGATTVATTILIANRAGIKVFATGGIGGVHRGNGRDVSADLPELAQTPITVVCSGAKIVLDLSATREWLETYGISVLGWQCDEMPAFYSHSSGLDVDLRIDDAEAAVSVIRSRDELELGGSVLVTVPVPEAFKIERSELEAIISDALIDADRGKIVSKDVTPYLLAKLSEKSGGRTLAANIELLKNNARVAAKIAVALDR